MAFSQLNLLTSVGITAKIIYSSCDFVNKINKQCMHKSMCECIRENKVKFIDQKNAEWLIQNQSRLVKTDFAPHTIYLVML